MPKDFFADNVSMKSRLLDGMLRFWKHAPVLEIFGLNFGYFNNFHYWVRGGVLAEMTCVIGTCRRRTKQLQ